jgi:aryl sulfotransferase
MTPNQIRPALRETRSRIFDSALWADYQPRADDILIATYPKCGTTWMQRIVSMLVAGSAAPAPIVSPWYDFRLMPPGVAHGMAEALTTRRILKTHLPFDAVPVYAGVKVIHVARDGRDSAMSFHNHMLGFKPEPLARLAEISRADPKFGDDFPPTPEDPAVFFREWLDDDAGARGDPACSYFHVEPSYWAARRDANMLLVHFNDLKADLGAEIRRVSDFLGITVEAEVWPKIVEAAGFETMRAQGDEILPHMQMTWDEGARRFLHKGTNERWRGVVSDEDLADYAAAVRTHFSPALAAWLEGGRLVAGDPATAED